MHKISLKHSPIVYNWIIIQLYITLNIFFLILGTLAYAGAQFGTVICFPISGLLASSSAGWPSIFYVFGALAVIWGIVFFVFGSDSPSKHSRISERERRYIENSLKSSEEKEKPSSETVRIYFFSYLWFQWSKKRKKSSIKYNITMNVSILYIIIYRFMFWLLKAMRTPWKAIFTSVPMWALIIVHCGQNWGYWTLITELPTYMNDVLEYNLVDVSKNLFYLWLI